MLTQVAFNRGWDAWQPANLETGFDLETKFGQGKCWAYLDETKLDAIAFEQRAVCGREKAAIWI